jgi:phospho-N-acetylmuramoyl-pentapeptide-transferase
MERVLAAGIFAMALSILAGPKFIDFMRRKEFGQHIREEGPADHHVKQGTPTMGGLLIIVSMIIPFLALSHYTEAGLTVFFVTLGCGAIGFIDDWFKVRHRRSLGLNGRWKLLLLAGITAGVGWSANDIGLSTDIYAPVLDWRIGLSFGFYVLLFLIIAGADTQRSHTAAGMTPARMSSAKSLQPMQNAKTDSSVAATTRSPRTA